MRTSAAIPAVTLILVTLGWTWLPSQSAAARPAAVNATYYVAPSGNDAAPGTHSAPFRTVGFALTQLSGGDTLILRGGRYYERGLELAAAGTVSAPIVLRAFPGEVPVLDGSYPEFLLNPGAAWEPAPGAAALFRSTALYDDAEAVFGYMTPSDGDHALVPYESRSTLASAVHVYTDRAPYYYVGPGIAWYERDTRIYARLEHGPLQHRLGALVPADVDARRTPLVLFPDETLLTLTSTARHVVIDGLEFQFGGRALELQTGVAHVTVRRCGFRCGRYSVVVRTGVSALEIDEARFSGHFPSYVARSDVKEPEVGRPAHFMQGAAISLSGSTDDVLIRRSTFRGLFDAIDAADRPSRLRVVHCTFEDIRDDVLQLGTAGHSVEFGYNELRRVMVGPSWHGSGAPPQGAVGTKYVHHNVIDATSPQLHAREDPNHLLPASWQGPSSNGFAVGQPVGIHDSELATGPDPWKVYNNTFFFGADVDGGGAGVEYRLDAFNAAIPHQVLNNVFVQVADHPILIGARVDDGSQRYDGNLYFRAAPSPVAPLFVLVARGDLEFELRSLAELRVSPVLRATRLHYPVGWESQGIEADPMLDAAYTPTAASPAASGAIDLSHTGWPGATQEVYRGARGS